MKEEMQKGDKEAKNDARLFEAGIIRSHTKRHHKFCKSRVPWPRIELVAIKVNLRKGQEVVEKCISTVKDNVNKKMQT